MAMMNRRWKMVLAAAALFATPAISMAEPVAAEVRSLTACKKLPGGMKQIGTCAQCVRKPGGGAFTVLKDSGTCRRLAPPSR